MYKKSFLNKKVQEEKRKAILYIKDMYTYSEVRKGVGGLVDSTWAKMHLGKQ